MVPEPRTAVIFSSALTSSSECETQDAYRQTRLVPGHHNNKPSSPPLAEHCLARRRFFLNLEDQNGARTVWADPVTKWTMNTLGHFRHFRLPHHDSNLDPLVCRPTGRSTSTRNRNPCSLTGSSRLPRGLCFLWTGSQIEGVLRLRDLPSWLQGVMRAV